MVGIGSAVEGGFSFLYGVCGCGGGGVASVLGVDGGRDALDICNALFCVIGRGLRREVVRVWAVDGWVGMPFSRRERWRRE